MRSARTSASIYTATFGEVIAATPAAESSPRPTAGLDLDQIMDLVVIRFSYLVKARTCSLDDLLHRENARSKKLCVVGKNLTGQSVASEARSNFAMDVFTYHSPAVRKIETAGDAHVRPLNDMLRQADLVCIPQFFARNIAQEVCECAPVLMSSKSVFLAWEAVPPIERAISYLSTNYADQIHLDDLANLAAVSKFHLVRLFSRTLGTTPHRYLTLLRVTHAKALLRSGDGTGEVAFRVGFFDQSHFCRNFRLITGMTPSEYQGGRRTKKRTTAISSKTRAGRGSNN